jgi:hypothetical protein
MHGPINVKSPNNTSKWQMGFKSAFNGLIFKFGLVCGAVKAVGELSIGWTVLADSYVRHQCLCLYWSSFVHTFKHIHLQQLPNAVPPTFIIFSNKLTNQMQQFYWFITWRFVSLNMFRAPPRPSSGAYNCINLLKTKRRLPYLKTQSVPRCKHFLSRL